MHTIHADIHDAGLADNCEACARHAAQPWNTLDRDTLTDLTVRTLRNRFGGTDSPYGTIITPRSTTEAVAMAGVMSQLERFGAFASTCPREVAMYLHDRWHTSLPVGGGEFEDAGVRMLLDGLGVESITELAALVTVVRDLGLRQVRDGLDFEALADEAEHGYDVAHLDNDAARRAGAARAARLRTRHAD